MVPLRCWSTTPDERGTAAKIPHHQKFSTEQASGTLGDLLYVETKYDGTATIILVGEFDMTGTERFYACVSEALATRRPSMTVEARGLTFIDSSGLMALLRAREAADETHMAFHVSEPSPALRRVAALYGVEDLLLDE